MPKRSPTLGELWAAYGQRRPVSRWVSRASMIVGVVLGVAVTVGAVVVCSLLLIRLLAWTIEALA